MNPETTINREQAVPTGALPAATWARASWRMRGGYFWFFAAVATFSPFAALYYRELGFSGVQVGLLTALPSLGASLTGPLWGAVADSLGIHRLVLRAGLALGALLALAASQPTGFWPLLALIALLAFALVPVAPLMDHYGVSVAERSGKSYGSLRVLGSIGYMVVVYVMGLLMDDDTTSFIFLAYAACLGLTLLSVIALPPLAERHTRPLFGGLRAVLGNRPLLLVMLVAYLTSSAASLIYVFLGIHVQELGGSNALVGAAFSISALSELPVIAFGGWLIARLGARRLITLALLAHLLRFVAFGFITVPEWLIAAQLLHGLSFGGFLVASVPLAHRLAGREHAATAQALLSTMSFGFGSITGALVGGALLDQVSTHDIFRGAAGLMVLTLALFVAGNRLVGLDRPASP